MPQKFSVIPSKIPRNLIVISLHFFNIPVYIIFSNVFSVTLQNVHDKYKHYI